MNCSFHNQATGDVAAAQGLPYSLVYRVEAINCAYWSSATGGKDRASQTVIIDLRYDILPINICRQPLMEYA
jgi:hypothetical protein